MYNQGQVIEVEHGYNHLCEHGDAKMTFDPARQGFELVEEKRKLSSLRSTKSFEDVTKGKKGYYIENDGRIEEWTQDLVDYRHNEYPSREHAEAEAAKIQLLWYAADVNEEWKPRPNAGFGVYVNRGGGYNSRVVMLKTVELRDRFEEEHAELIKKASLML